MWLIEDPYPPVIALAIGAVVCAVIGKQRQNLLLLVGAGVLLASIGLVFVIDLLVVTEAEIVADRVMELKDAVENDDVDRVLSFLGENLEAERLQIYAAMGAFRLVPPIRLTDVDVEMKLNDSYALSFFRANGTVRAKQGGFESRIATRWKLSWRKVAGEWKVNEVQRLDPMNGEPINILSPSR
ncbi:hypothetical protein [Stratiformator vulcanicus]|uniref:DUF4440 domain-containing protein n=1 Tax=Stratiformator vulcanicus TaxID=2527980 RepID=A0A517R349_9PLAN|nr:hypothetical protein [Stratiformator vulcanicus]QDT38281.1 hypothetical protein Pan189_26710 [Stratiformator vulcanicus]